MGPSWGPGDSAGGAGSSGSGGGGGGAAPVGGGGGGAGPAAAPTAPRGGGIPIDFRRGKTSKELLEIDWTYPVWKPTTGGTAAADAHTVVVEREHALPIEEAYRLIADSDRRPLLVLRECELCKGTDHALVSRSLDNEQTVLLTHWFRCVKLPPNVLDDKHPFFNLFKPDKPGAVLPHLFFASWDGNNKVALPGDQSQAELWKIMFDVLDREYRGNAKKQVKDLRVLLSRFDSVDALEQQLKARMDQEIDKRGPDSPRLKKMHAQLDDLQAQRQDLREKCKQLRELALVAEAEPAAPKAEAGGG